MLFLGSTCIFLGPKQVHEIFCGYDKCSTESSDFQRGECAINITEKNGMNTQSLQIIKFLIVVVGVASADWFSVTDCTHNPPMIIANNGNCVPNTTSSVPMWNLYSCTDPLYGQQFSCSDPGCNLCELIDTFPLKQCLLVNWQHVMYRCSPEEPDYRGIFGSGYALRKTLLRHNLVSTALSTYALPTACRGDVNTYCTSDTVYSNTYYTNSHNCSENFLKSKHQFTIGMWEDDDTIWLPCQN